MHTQDNVNAVPDIWDAGTVVVAAAVASSAIFHCSYVLIGVARRLAWADTGALRPARGGGWASSAVSWAARMGTALRTGPGWTWWSCRCHHRGHWRRRRPSSAGSSCAWSHGLICNKNKINYHWIWLQNKKALDCKVIISTTFPQQVCYCSLLVFAPLNAPIQQQHQVGSGLKI